MIHQSVLLTESLMGLAIKPDGIYIDATFGRGGHSRAILNALSDKGRLIALDRDQAAVHYANQNFSDDPRFCIYEAPFKTLAQRVSELGLLGKVHGILLDLGVSSPQLETAERGFSFKIDGPLDMRMGLDVKQDAKSFIANATIEEMAHVFREYGEERYSLRIARAIAAYRETASIETTLMLAKVITAAIPRRDQHKHPATRVFQAIRIHINEELSQLKQVLKDSLEVLTIGGRLVCISFHSLEDRIVKTFMKQQAEGPLIPKWLPISKDAKKLSFQRIGKAIKPSLKEQETNVRSRSAILRIGEKLA